MPGPCTKDLAKIEQVIHDHVKPLQDHEMIPARRWHDLAKTLPGFTPDHGKILGISCQDYSKTMLGSRKYLSRLRQDYGMIMER